MLKLLKSLFKTISTPFVRIFRYFFPKNNRVKPDSFNLPPDAIPLASASLPNLVRPASMVITPTDKILTKQEIINNYDKNPLLRDISLAYHIIADTAELLKTRTRSVSDINDLVNHYECFDLDRFLSLLSSKSMHFYRFIRDKIYEHDINIELENLLKFELSLVAITQQHLDNTPKIFHPNSEFMREYYYRTGYHLISDQLFRVYVKNFAKDFYQARCNLYPHKAANNPTEKIFTTLLQRRALRYNDIQQYFTPLINLDPICSPTSPRP